MEEEEKKTLRQEIVNILDFRECELSSISKLMLNKPFSSRFYEVFGADSFHWKPVSKTYCISKDGKIKEKKEA